jgi:hypothetical protein
MMTPSTTRAVNKKNDIAHGHLFVVVAHKAGEGDVTHL